MVGDPQIFIPIEGLFLSLQCLTPQSVLMQRAEAGTVCANGPPQQCCNTNGVCESNACPATCIASGEACGSAGAPGVCCEDLVCSEAGTCVPFTCPSGAVCGSCPAQPRKLCIDPDGVGPNEVSAQSTCGVGSCQALCTAVCGTGTYTANDCSNEGVFPMLLMHECVMSSVAAI
jgi:hypothetical protein